MAESMRLIDWRPLRKGRLLGFGSVELPIIGLYIFEVPVLQGRAGIWAALPTRPKVNDEGRVLRDVDGRPAYARVLGWRTKRLEEAFSSKVVALVQASHPQDL
jgi:hypothetical protein